MSLNARRPLVSFALVTAFVAAMLVSSQASQRISISHPNATTTVVRIDEPIVNQRMTEYRSVTFQTGDTVTVRAGGCVQTGGHGRTWKRYVNPSGDNSDRLYHGLIWIPGAMGGLVRVQGWVNRPIAIPAGVTPAQGFLRLGYEDDGYGDNSYSAHDDGTEDQCKGTGGGAAWIELTIVRRPIITTPPPATTPPFDVIAASADDNGIPLNPRWGAQVPPPGVLPGPGLCGLPWAAPCTTQAPAIDKYWLCNGHGPLGGHANWTAATFEGTAIWNSHSTPGTDDDYNVDLVTNALAGLTDNNPEVLHNEFDSDETIDHFTTSWWQGFHDAVDASDAAAHAVIDGKYAVMTGLFGLDCAHSCGSELHPVWLFALRVSDTPNDETWAIFVRNWGNEGFCGDQEHYLDLQTLRIRLPWRAGASAVTVSKAEFLTNSSQVTGPSLEPVINRSVSVVFTLPPPEQHARVNGVLHLQWTGGGAATGSLTAAQVTALRARIARQKVREKDEPEDLVAESLAKLPAAARQQMFTSMPAKPVERDAVGLRATMAAAGPPRATPARPRVRAVADDATANAKRQRKEIVGKAIGGRIQ